MAAALDLALGEQPEPAFNLIEPGGVSWGEVKVVSRTLRQPIFDQIGFVSGVVVQDDMNVEFGRNRRINEVEKFAKLHASMFGEAAANDFAGGDIQGGEEAGGAMTKVIGRSPFDLARLQGKNRLRAA